MSIKISNIYKHIYKCIIKLVEKEEKDYEWQ